MHLVPPDRPSAQALGAARLDEPLGASEHGIEVEEPEPRRLAPLALDPVWIPDDAPEHLVATAQPQQPAAPAQVRPDVHVPALRSEETHVADGRLRAGQDHEVGVARQGVTRRHEPHLDPGFGDQRIQIVEVGDTREHRDRGHEGRVGPGLGVAAHRHRVLRWQPVRMLEVRHHPETREAGPAADDLDAGVEEPDVAAKPVDDVSAHSLPFGR